MSSPRRTITGISSASTTTSCTASDFKLRVRDYKSGFCIADHWGHAIGVPHGPPRFLGNCEQFHPEARVRRGGLVRRLHRPLPGVLPRTAARHHEASCGRYWLVHRANEDFHLRETSYRDNVASLLIRLTWRDGTPSVTTLRTCSRERC